MPTIDLVPLRDGETKPAPLTPVSADMTVEQAEDNLRGRLKLVMVGPQQDRDPQNILEQVVTEFQLPGETVYPKEPMEDMPLGIVGQVLVVLGDGVNQVFYRILDQEMNDQGIFPATAWGEELPWETTYNACGCLLEEEDGRWLISFDNENAVNRIPVRLKPTITTSGAIYDRMRHPMAEALGRINPVFPQKLGDWSSPKFLTDHFSDEAPVGEFRVTISDHRTDGAQFQNLVIGYGSGAYSGEVAHARAAVKLARAVEGLAEMIRQADKESLPQRWTDIIMRCNAKLTGEAMGSVLTYMDNIRLALKATDVGKSWETEKFQKHVQKISRDSDDKIDVGYWQDIADWAAEAFTKAGNPAMAEAIVRFPKFLSDTSAALTAISQASREEKMAMKRVNADEDEDNVPDMDSASGKTATNSLDTSL